MEFTVKQIAYVLGGKVDGDSHVTINDFAKIEEGKEHSITFLSNPKYEHFVYTTKASAIIVNKDFKPTQPVKATLIRVDDSYQALAKLLETYEKMQPQKEGIEQPSFIAASATTGKGLYLGAFAYIGEKAVIGKNVKIYPQVYIGDGVKIGDNTTIYAGAKIYKNCVVGQNCVIHAGVVIGGDGFGFAPNEKGEYEKIPQIGNVVLEDNVEIGANTCIDRATMGSTRIEKGTKLDNLIQVAHNVEIGENTVIAAQTGIAGSAKIGSNCMFGGQTGIAGHIQIANGTKTGAQTGIPKTIKEEGKAMFGSPALEYLDFQRSYVVFKNLPAIKKEHDQLWKDREQ